MISHVHTCSLLVPPVHLGSFVVSRERHNRGTPKPCFLKPCINSLQALLIFVTHTSFQSLAMFPKVFFGALFASVAFAATNTTSVQIHPDANNGKCLDVKGDVLANGTAVQM